MTSSRLADVNRLSFSAPDDDEMIAAFARDKFVHLPGYLSPDEAAWLLSTTEHVPSRPVTCGIPDVSWSEQNFESGQPAYDLFMTPQATGLVGRLTGLGRLDKLVCWTSCYAPGEYINPHSDTVPVADRQFVIVQLLICLRAPSDASQGGVLHVAGTELFLTPGDAIAFKATELEHYTSRSPEARTVLVGRYYME